MRPCPPLKRRGTENTCGSIVPGAGKSVVTMVALARMRTSGTIRFGGCHRRARERNVLEIVPMTLREANAFVEQNHRHHGATVGHKFSIGLSDGEKIVGVAIVGRPVSRHLDDGWTLEVNPPCTDRTPNCWSMVYAAAREAAEGVGLKRVVTYILEKKNGASPRAAGWKCVGQAGGLRWTGTRRPEVDLCPAQMKSRFEREETT